MTNENLYLIGTVHYDLDGPKRLERLLTQISPDVIALEFHKDLEDLMQERKNLDRKEEEKQVDESLKECGLLMTLKQKRAFLYGQRDINSVIGYEHKVSKAHTDANPKSRLEYIDISFFENGIQEFKDGYNGAMKRMISTLAQVPEIREEFLESLNNGKEGFLQSVRESAEMFYENAEIVEDIVASLRDPTNIEMIKEQMSLQEFQAMNQIYHPKRDDAMSSRIREFYDGGNYKLVAVTGLLHVPGLKSRIPDLEPTVMTLADDYALQKF